MALSTRVDNILLILYAPVAGGRSNTPLSSLARLHQLVYLLQQEGLLWLPRGRSSRYLYVQTEFGLFSADFFDDIFALNAVNCLNLERPPPAEKLADGFELRRYFGDLNHGEGLFREFEHFASGLVSLSASTGERLAGLLFNALEVEDRDYLISFNTRFAEQDLAPLVRP